MESKLKEAFNEFKTAEQAFQAALDDAREKNIPAHESAGEEFLKMHNAYSKVLRIRCQMAEKEDRTIRPHNKMGIWVHA
jgi:hypothetical protein